MIEIRTIQHALAVAKFRDFKKAAQSVYTTRSALVYSIQTLEDELGVNLFARGKEEKVKPTIIGHVFLARAEEILKAASELRREMDFAVGLKMGQLRIGAGPGPAELHMGKAIGQLSRVFPHAYINLTVSDYTTLADLLRSDQIELFVAETSELEMASDLFITPFNELRAYLVCRKGHPLLDRSDFTLKECLEYPIAMTKLPRRAIDSIAKILGLDEYSNDLGELPLIRCDSISVMKTVITFSDVLGIAFLPLIDRELQLGEFVILPCNFPELKSHYGLVQRQDHALSPLTEHFTIFLKEVDAEVAKTGQVLQEVIFSTR